MSKIGATVEIFQHLPIDKVGAENLRQPFCYHAHHLTKAKDVHCFAWVLFEHPQVSTFLLQLVEILPAVQSFSDSESECTSSSSPLCFLFILPGLVRGDCG